MKDLAPLDFYLGQNYPNPFKEKTTIKFCLPYKTRVNLTVYDPRGKLIKTLLDEEKCAGTYEVEFNPLLKKTIKEPDKIILYYRLKAGRFSIEKQMLLMR